MNGPALLFDTETTGTSDDDQIIEAATSPAELDENPTTGYRIRKALITVQRYKPSREISYGAMATHGILAQDLVDCPPSSSFALPEGTEYLIGHNIDFDWRMAGKPNMKRICTLALSRRLWPGLDSHKQNTILFFLLDNPEEARSRVQHAHSAYVDVENLATVLNAICGEVQPRTMEDLWVASEDARIPINITFGKYKAPAGEPPRKFDTLPRDYLEWMLRQKDMDPYTLEAARRALSGGR